MKGTDILSVQLNGSFSPIAAQLASKETSRHWDDMAFEAANPPGFTLWHCARTIDWGVQCAIRGTDEVARRGRWTTRVPGRFRFVAGVPSETAQEVAGSFSPDAASEYLDDLKAGTLVWFSQQTDDTLDDVPTFRGNDERVEGYTDPEVWAEIASLEGIPIWQILARPCISHIRVHIGEVEVVLQSLGGTRHN
jgi:hypothetical protein